MKIYKITLLLFLLPVSLIAQFICPPCNLDCDTLHFAAAGICPHCNMTLIADESYISTDERILKAIKEAELEENIMRSVSFLSDVYGPRLMGTPNYYQSAVWIKNELESWGISNVELQSFDENHVG